MTELILLTLLIPTTVLALHVIDKRDKRDWDWSIQYLQAAYTISKKRRLRK